MKRKLVFLAITLAFILAVAVPAVVPSYDAGIDSEGTEIARVLEFDDFNYLNDPECPSPGCGTSGG